MKIHLIYLAAGSSRRFGSNKLLWKYKGKAMYLYGLEKLQSLVQSRSDCTLTVVSRYEEILDYAKGCAVYSPLSSLGISYSIRAALEKIEFEECDYFLFMVADQPEISFETVRKVADAAYTGCLTASASYDRQPASPTLFSAALAEELLALKGDSGGRQIINSHPENHLDIKASSPDELADIDYNVLSGQL